MMQNDILCEKSPKIGIKIYSGTVSISNNAFWKLREIAGKHVETILQQQFVNVSINISH